MEAITQRQDDVLPAVPRTDERRAFERQEPQGVGERLRVAGDLHDEGDAVGSTVRRQRLVDGLGVDGGHAQVGCEPSTPRAWLDGDDVRPGALQEHAVSRPTTPRPLTTTVSSSTGPASSVSCSAVSTKGSNVATRASTGGSGTTSDAGTTKRSWWGWKAKTSSPTARSLRLSATRPTQL